MQLSLIDVRSEENWWLCK